MTARKWESRTFSTLDFGNLLYYISSQRRNNRTAYIYPNWEDIRNSSLTEQLAAIARSIVSDTTVQSEDHIHSSSRLELLLIILALAALSAIPFIAMWHNYIPLTVATLILAVAIYRQLVIAVQVAIVVVGAFAWKYVWPASVPFFLAGPVAIYFFLIFILPQFKQFRRWFSLGNLQPGTLTLMLATVLVSSAALVVWNVLAKPDLQLWMNAIPKAGAVPLAFIGLGFAVVNAAIEELLFRGIILQCLEAIFGKTLFPILLQAIAFGFIHFAGVPSGWLGVGLASIYGLFLGFVKRGSEGMLAPFLAHLIADLVIYVLLFQAVARNGS